MSRPRTPAFTMPPPGPATARHSVVPLWAVYTAATVTGFVSLIGSMRAGVAQAPALAAASCVLFGAFGVLCAWLLAKIPFFWPVSHKTRALAAVWGATAATGYALMANLAIYQRIADGTDPSRWSLFAPFTEEPIKDLGIVVVVLLAATRPRTALDGLVVGSFVGLGFEVVEKVVQSVTNAVAAAPSGHPGQWASLGTDVVHEVLRGVWTGHIVITGIAGFGIGYAMTARRRPMSHRVAVAAALILLAFAGHLLWNSHRFGLFYVLGQFGLLAFYLWLVRVGRAQEANLYRPFLGYLEPSVLGAGPGGSRRDTRRRKRTTARLAAAIGNGDAAQAHRCVESLTSGAAG